MFIREEMRDQKISQEKLAYSLNIPQSGISDRLSGKAEWSHWEILNVFDILGIEFDYKKEIKDGKN
jgi:predicted XRE-type DNA-binding protein